MLNEAWVVVPAYNEERAIANTLQGLATAFANIVVVDDHSTDATGSIAKKSGVHVCRHPVNLGQGAALQTGIDYAIRKGAEVIVTFDADGQHRVGDAVAMVKRLNHEGVDVVLASRFIGSTEGMTVLRRLLLMAATIYTRWTTSLDLTDTHNGLRAMTSGAARTMRIRQNRMAHASEILEQIASRGLTYVEHPVTIVYTEYSKMKGQRMSGAFAVLTDLYVRRMYK